jgi:hypothetical protein
MKKIFSTILFSLALPALDVSAQSATSVPFENIENMENCYQFSLFEVPEYERKEGKPFLNDQMVIGDKDAYLTLQNTIISNTSCKIIFPPVDFSKNTLLLNYATGNCAWKAFERNVTRNEKKKEIIYSVKAIEGTYSCSGPGHQSLNLISIPKPPKDFKIKLLPLSDNSGFRSYSCKDGKMVARDWWGKYTNLPPAPRNGDKTHIEMIDMNCAGKPIGEFLSPEVIKLFHQYGWNPENPEK